jgi:hypothetical protein
MERRKFLVGTCSHSVCLANFPIDAMAQSGRLPPFCSLDSSFDVNQYRRMSTSGNVRLDRALIVELRKLVSAFQINPGFQYIEDADSPNAFALDRTLISGTNGTILFGINLIESELSSNFGGAAVAGIAAHEGAHILQYFSDFGERLNSNTARERELHADFLAGYYFGLTDRSERSLVAFGNSLFSRGDFNFNDQGHHGTPDERLESMKSGYKQFKIGNNLRQAVEEGIDYVWN